MDFIVCENLWFYGLWIKILNEIVKKNWNKKKCFKKLIRILIFF